MDIRHSTSIFGDVWSSVTNSVIESANSTIYDFLVYGGAPYMIYNDGAGDGSDLYVKKFLAN